MKTILGWYSIALLVGLAFGLVFPTLVPTWLFICGLMGIIFINELLGAWGFGNHWHDYRWGVHLIRSGVAICACLGILLGNGKVGAFLVTIGTLISR